MATLRLMVQTNPARLGRAANEAHFERPPAQLWDVKYKLRNGHEGSIPMISRTMAGAMCRVLDLLNGNPPRLLDAQAREVDPC